MCRRSWMRRPRPVRSHLIVRSTAERWRREPDAVVKSRSLGNLSTLSRSTIGSTRLAIGTRRDREAGRAAYPAPALVPRPSGLFRLPTFRHTILSMVSEEQIQQWADEAEAGYDVEEMKRRGRGRPGRGAEPMQVVAVRLTADELAAVDAIAEREHISRSEAIRRALAGFAA